MASHLPLIAAGIALVVICALGALFWPFVAADMRRAVDREASNDNGPDMTALALAAIVAPSILLGVPGGAAWLWWVA